MLAALDWNTMESSPVTDSEGKQERQQIHTKRKMDWVLRNKYRVTSNNHVAPLMERVIQVQLQQETLPVVGRPDLPKNIAKKDKPPKEVALEKGASRFAGVQQM